MKFKSIAITFTLTFSLLAGNLPGGTPRLEVVPSTTALPTEVLYTPTQTPLPTATPLPSLTPTPIIPIAWPSDKGVNCRLGPGTGWVAVGALLVGETATIQGRNGDSSWWYVVTKGDPGSPCWVAASVTITAGNISLLPTISPPTAKVTKARVNLDPEEITLPTCLDPSPEITIKGIIETNGPVKVNYYFETQQGGIVPPDSVNFKGADSKTVEITYTPPTTAGTFWVKLIVTGPNDRVGEAEYKIECT